MIFVSSIFAKSFRSLLSEKLQLRTLVILYFSRKYQFCPVKFFDKQQSTGDWSFFVVIFMNSMKFQNANQSKNHEDLQKNQTSGNHIDLI